MRFGPEIVTAERFQIDLRRVELQLIAHIGSKFNFERAANLAAEEPRLQAGEPENVGAVLEYFKLAVHIVERLVEQRGLLEQEVADHQAPRSIGCHGSRPLYSRSVENAPAGDFSRHFLQFDPGPKRGIA